MPVALRPKAMRFGRLDFVSDTFRRIRLPGSGFVYKTMGERGGKFPHAGSEMNDCLLCEKPPVP